MHGPLAVGVSGEDAGLISAAPAHPELGFVGDVGAVNPAILQRLLDEDLIPVVATIGSRRRRAGVQHQRRHRRRRGRRGDRAEKLVYLTDIEGLRRDVDDPASLIRQTTAAELDALVADGTIAGGMIPKVESCVRPCAAASRAAHILDGRIPHVLLLEIFTDAGIGTMVSADGGAR